MDIRSHWICSPPLMCSKLPKTTVEEPRHKSIWSARVHSLTHFGGRLVQYSFLLHTSSQYFLFWHLSALFPTLPLTINTLFLCVHTLSLLYFGPYCVGPGKMSTVSSCGCSEYRPKRQRFGLCRARGWTLCVVAQDCVFLESVIGPLFPSCYLIRVSTIVAQLVQRGQVLTSEWHSGSTVRVAEAS